MAFGKGEEGMLNELSEMISDRIKIVKANIK